MNDPNHVVITIARQYGSGGRTIGRMLADKLKITYYSRELIRLASDDSGINEELFAKHDENIGKKFFKKLSPNVYKGELLKPEQSGFVLEPNLFNYQAKIIKEIAQKESCVIIGRCADFILKDNPDTVSVFVHANADFCLEKAMENNSMTESEMREFIYKTDKYRAEYYMHHTGRYWNDARNYDLCLDSSKLGFENTMEAILDYIRRRGKNV